MAVLPVSSVRFNNSTAVNFGRRGNKESENKENNYNSQKASGMVTVPAALLLALATSAINVSQPAAAQPTESETKVEMVSSVGQASSSTTAPRFQDVFHKLPYYSAYLAPRRMKMSLPVIANGKRYNLVYASLGKADNNEVENIYFIQDGYKHKVNYVQPPEVKSLIYHNLGDPNKDFCGLAIEASTPNEDGTYSKVTYETRIDDDTANLLIDLIAGDSKYKNSAGLEMVETSSPNVRKTKIY